MMMEVRDTIAAMESTIAVAAEMGDACAVPAAAAMPATTADVTAEMAATDVAAATMPASAVAAADLNHQVVRHRLRRRRNSGIDGRHRRRALDRHGRQREHRSCGKAQAADKARC